MLEIRDGVGRPHVLLAAQAERVLAPRLQRVVEHRRIAEGIPVARHRFSGDYRQVHAFHCGGRTREVLVDEAARQPYGVEDLGPAVGLIGRDSHLRHHLEDALANRADVRRRGRLGRHFARQQVAHSGQRLERQIRIDRLGAVAGQHAEVMHLARLAGLDDETRRGPQAATDQVTVHGTRRKQRRHRNAVGPGRPVGQHQDGDAGAHLLFRFAPEFGDGSGEAAFAGGRIERHVEHRDPETGFVAGAQPRDPGQFRVGQDRLFQANTPRRVRLSEAQQVGARTDEGDQRHHHLFPDGIDRGVRHLREVLLEVLVQELRAPRQRRQRGVGAHRSHRFRPGGGHRHHQEGEILLGVAEGLLPIQAGHVGGARGDAGRQFRQP